MLYIKYGYSQESVVGPLSFVIYVIDIYTIFKNVKIILFSDDTQF